MQIAIPSSRVREALGRQTVRSRASRLRRITSRPFGLTTDGMAVMLGDESSSAGLATEIRAAIVSFGRYQALSFPAQDAEVTVISRHPLPDRPRFDPVTDLEPFCSGWATFMEDLSERLYGHPRPSLG